MRTAMSPATPALHSPPRPPQFGPSLAQHLERHLAVQDAIRPRDLGARARAPEDAAPQADPTVIDAHKFPSNAHCFFMNKLQRNNRSFLHTALHAVRSVIAPQPRAHGGARATWATLRSLPKPTMPAPALQLACVECMCRVSICVLDSLRPGGDSRIDH